MACRQPPNRPSRRPVSRGGVRTACSGASPSPFRRSFDLFDDYGHEWIPARDAESVAEKLLASPGEAVGTRPLASAMGWLLRRLNPAVALLVEEGAAHVPPYVTGDAEVIGVFVRITNKTQRWLREAR